MKNNGVFIWIEFSFDVSLFQQKGNNKPIKTNIMKTYTLKQLVKAILNKKNNVVVYKRSMRYDTYYSFDVNGECVYCLPNDIITYPVSFQERYGMEAWNIIINILPK